MDRKVVCPQCKYVQQGLVLIGGKLYTLINEQIGTRVLSYECLACKRRVHYGERDSRESAKLKSPTANIDD